MLSTCLTRLCTEVRMGRIWNSTLSLLIGQAALAGVLIAQDNSQPMYPATAHPSQMPNNGQDNAPPGMNQNTGQNEPGSTQIPRDQEMPVFRVQVTARTTSAVNYRNRGGSTTIGFRGTDLMPDVGGEAKVE